MMVETMLESSQDFGMAGGALPQWKRELLQRRAARSRPAAQPSPPAPPAPPPPPADEDEELRYGPGIVKRLQSRYLSLALRDAPRRRASLLRRAASLEHGLDERAVPPARPAHAARPPRPLSVAAPPAHAHAARRESVKRARSVDALSRMDARDEPRAGSSSPPPPPLPPAGTRPLARSARTPRRPMPLLRDTERPPPDVVRSTLRKFESAPPRRATPATRVSAVLRDLRGPRTSTPEPRESADPPPQSPRTPSPSPREDAAAAAGPEEAGGGGSRRVSRAALEGIARAGCSVRYAFEAPRAASHLPPLAATNALVLGRARRVGVIRPMPARGPAAASPLDGHGKPAPLADTVRSPSPPAFPPPDSELAPPSPPARCERREPPPAALVEPIPRPPPSPRSSPPTAVILRSPSPEQEIKLTPETIKSPITNGHVTFERTPESKGIISRIGAAGIERAWSGSGDKKAVEVRENKESAGAVPWARARDSRPRAPPPAATSVVFNFSNRKEVPDYIENDGIILRANRRNRIKAAQAGEAGVVLLRPAALAPDSDSESELDGGGPPSPCAVRFVNDNVLINGRSSLYRPRHRPAKLKLQFDDSLTRTFEYPSETSLCEEGGPPPPAAPDSPPPAPGGPPPADPAPQLAESPLLAPLAANTHITSASLARYTPCKTAPAAFQLGVTRHQAPAPQPPQPPAGEEDGEGGEEGRDGAARSWSEARTLHTDLLF